MIPHVEDADAAMHAAAATWLLVQERGASAAEQRRLTAWLAASPRHREALEAVQSAAQQLNDLSGAPELADMRCAALSARPASRSSVRTFSLAAASAAALSLGGVFAWSLTPSWIFGSDPAVSAPQTRFATAVGERSTATLPDGSVVSLNTATILDVDYSDGERAVRLHSGQAQFHVAHGSNLPFRVYAGDRVVTATGTIFDVNLARDDVRVALLQGRITVAPAASGRKQRSPSETLSPGEMLIARPGVAVSVRREDVLRLTQWRDGLVAFDDTPLSEAVQEVNRYTTRPVVLASPEVGRLRISGTFRVAEPERFAHTVAELFPLDVKLSADRITVTDRK